MNYFYLYIFLLLTFIIAVSYFNTYMNSYRETFNSVKQTLVLGDSIIIKKDDVTDGKSV
jgi:hypothetical protein